MKSVKTPSTVDVFCCGHAWLPSGNLLIGGGTKDWGWVGEDAVFEIPATTFRSKPVFKALAKMKHGRWYPTYLTLANGKILAISGAVESHSGSANDPNIDSHEIEIYDPSNNTWTAKRPIPDFSPAAYARVHQLPNGDVICTSPVRITDSDWKICKFEKSEIEGAAENITWKPAYNLLSTEYSLGSGSAATDVSSRLWFRWGSTLLPFEPDSKEARILITGGCEAHVLKFDADANITDVHSDSSWNSGLKKWDSNTVILPTGHILVVGGANSPDPTEFQTMTVESIEAKPQTGKRDQGTWPYQQTIRIFDPDNNAWYEGGQIIRNRVYHSTAILTREGKVWIGGSNPECMHSPNGAKDFEVSVEIHHPWYYRGHLNSNPQPKISGSFKGSVANIARKN
jgi:hypothetical protein